MRLLVNTPQITPRPLSKELIKAAVISLADRKMVDRKARRIAQEKLAAK